MIRRLQLWIRNIFGFSRAEANGLIILLPLMILIIFSQPIYRMIVGDPPLEFDEDQSRIDSLIASWDFYPIEQPDEFTLFTFDPNTCTKEEMDSLGFSNFLSDRIILYRSKGGRFINAADLLKIYGMDSSFYESLRPFISIKTNPVAAKKIDKDQITKNKRNEVSIFFDINLADTTQLKRLKGIGTVLASRIVKYRDILGGFYDISQVKEVYGLDSTVVMEVVNHSFISPDFMPRQLNINKATEREFSQHPYIKFKLATTIIAYRFQHGSFAEIDDLLKIDLIDQNQLNKLRPYLKVN
ncbi:MAG TPA: helix-hairpin-helix domain-containing protein [Cyclobacteriaceae bacterium]